MAHAPHRIEGLIRDALEHGEMRPLAITVAVRKGLSGEPFKGDLSRSVKAALHMLVRTNAVRETDGTYALSRAERAAH